SVRSGGTSRVAALTGVSSASRQVRPNRLAQAVDFRELRRAGEENQLVAAGLGVPVEVRPDRVGVGQRVGGDVARDLAEPGVVVEQVRIGRRAGVAPERVVPLGDLARRARAAGCLPRLVDRGAELAELLRRAAAVDPAVAEPGNTAERGVDVAGDEHLRPTGAARRRADLSLRGGGVAGPDAPHVLELVVERTPAAAGGETAHLVVVVARAEPHAERQATVREGVERRRLLREHERIRPQRRDEDRGHEADPRRRAGDRREGHQRLEVAVDEPVDDADAAEARLLGTPRPLENAVAPGARDRGWETDADAHGPRTLLRS